MNFQFRYPNHRFPVSKFRMADQDAFKKALAEARAKAAKFREEGKLPPEDPNAKNIKVQLNQYSANNLHFF